MPYQPQDPPGSRPRTSNLSSVPQASDETEEESPADDVNKTNGEAVIETPPKVYSVKNLRATFNKRADEPMNSPDPSHRQSFPVKSSDARSFDDRSDVSGSSSNRGQSLVRPSWQNRAPSPSFPEPLNTPLRSGGSRPSWQNRGALQNQVSNGRESPTPPSPQRNGRASPAPRASLPVPTQGSRPSWQNSYVQQAPPTPPRAQQQPASRHSWRQNAPGQQLPLTDSLQQPPPPKQLSQAAMARQALQNQLNPEAQPPSWQKKRPPQARSSWQSQTQEAPVVAPRASLQERSQEQQQEQLSWPQNRTPSPEEVPDEEEDEQQPPRQNQTRPSPVIAPPKKFAPDSQPRQQRDYHQFRARQPTTRPRSQKSIERDLLQKDLSLVPAILPETESAKEKMSLPPVVLPQKERQLPPVVLPSKEAPKKELPPFILPSRDPPPKKELPPVILPSNEPPEEELPPVILSQKESNTIANNSASKPGADPPETNYEEQLQTNYSESVESAGSWQDHPAVLTGTSAGSPKSSPKQKSPLNRPPLPSPQNQKSPWQKWADMQGHDDLEIVKEVQVPERDGNVGSRTVEGVYVEEEKKSNDDATASVDDDELELAVQEAESEDKNTYLARMAADSTLIVDYEEAIKHESRPFLDDEDDSYISGGLTVQSSALPQDVPLEFQQALAGSPSKPIEPSRETEPVEEKPGTRPSPAEELLREDSFQENDEVPVLEREIETYASDDYEHETQMKTFAAPQHEPIMEALASPGHDPVDALEEIEEDYDDDEEEFSPTPTLPSTPRSGNRYPKLTPSPKDNETYPDVYRSMYFADDMPPTTSWGPERRRSSPRKASSPHSQSQLSPEVENTTTHLAQMQLAERASPVLYQGSYDSAEMYVDDKNPEQQVHELSPRKEASPAKQAQYMGVGLLASSQSIEEVHALSPRKEASPAKQAQYMGEGLLASSQSTEESSREHTSNLQTSYPDELIFSMRSRSRSNDEHESTYYPDPEFEDVLSEVESDAVFGIPLTYGAAGGEVEEAISPSIRQRGHAIEEWQATLSPKHSVDRSPNSVGQSPGRSYEHPLVSTSPERKKIANAANIVRFWANESASREEEEEEAEQFTETEEWKDRDPDFFPETEDDDDDVYRESYISQPRLQVATAPQDNKYNADEQEGGLEGWLQGSPRASPASGVSHLQAPVDPDTPESRAWVASSSFVSASDSQDPNDFSTPKKSKQKKKKKQEVFDPFGDEDVLKITNSDELFSPHPDPFGMTEESFSPPSWDTPRGRMSFGSPRSRATQESISDATRVHMSFGSPRSRATPDSISFDSESNVEI
jgi:hypothetical protein